MLLLTGYIVLNLILLLFPLFSIEGVGEKIREKTMDVDVALFKIGRSLAYMLFILFLNVAFCAVSTNMKLNRIIEDQNQVKTGTTETQPTTETLNK